MTWWVWLNSAVQCWTRSTGYRFASHQLWLHEGKILHVYHYHNISGITYHYLLYRVAQKVSQYRLIKKSFQTFQLH